MPGYPFLSPPQAADEIGRLGEYRILKKLGEGGMGFVFRAEDPGLKRFIALKVMRPEVAAKPNATDRFLREGRAAAGLKSDHIITIYQVGQANGVPFLAMEFLEGLPLDEWFKQQKKAIPLPHVLRVVRDTLRGLATAHDKGLIHRDIKPANLWLEKGTSRIKLLDFGLTRGNDADVQLTQEGAVVGTPAFMAPEQASGKPVDPRADLFSVGTVMYLLLAGKNPFARGDLMSTLGAVGFETQPPVTTVRPDVPKEYSDFLDRLLAKSPDGRPAHAKAALAELAAIEKGLQDGNRTLAPSLVAVPLSAPAPPVWDEITDTDTEPPPARPTRSKDAGPSKPTTNRKLLYGGGLFGLLAVLGGIVIIITNKDGTQTKVEVPDGAKVEVKDKGKTVATVGGKKEPPKKAAMDADRRAAEFAIGRGGHVGADVGDRDVTDIALLPAGPFKVRALYVRNTQQPVLDADLDLFRPLGELNSLALEGPISDAGLAKMADWPTVPKFENLTLIGHSVTDAGLKSLAKFTGLKTLGLYESKTIAGRGFAHLDGLQIKSLDLYRSEFEDADLVRLKKLPNLVLLVLGGTNVSDAGLVHVAELRKLTELNIGSCPKVTDAGYRHVEKIQGLNYLACDVKGFDERASASISRSIGKLKQLKHAELIVDRFTEADAEQINGLDRLGLLKLTLTAPTDAQLAALAKVKGLKTLNATGGTLTVESAAAFRKARPDVTLQGRLMVLSDPDRAAAEFILRGGGSVGIGELAVSKIDQLPKEPFRVTALGQPGHAGATPTTDADLELFKHLKDLARLTLNGPISDAGLATIAAYPRAAEFVTLGIHFGKITDAGLQVLPKFARVNDLGLLGGADLTGTGLVHLKGLPLRTLNLGNSGVRDENLAVLEHLPRLVTLSLYTTGITDEGLKHVGKARSLETLAFQFSKSVTDAGLVHLAGLDKLTNLECNGINGDRPHTAAGIAAIAKLKALKYLHVGVVPADAATVEKLQSLERLERLRLSVPANLDDAGLARLAQLKAIQELDIAKTSVTAAGVAAFRKARPEVKLTSDIEPDRAAAEWVIGKGGTVQIPGNVGYVTELAKLPPGPFKIIAVELGLRPVVTDADLDRFRDLASLTYLSVNGPVTDAGIAKLAEFPNAGILKTLIVPSPETTDAAFAALPRFKSLVRFQLSSAKVTGAGLAHLKGSNVESLHLCQAKLADAELAKLKDLPKLTVLDLTETTITDAGLKHVGGLKPLTVLYLYGVLNVTDAGAKHLEGLTELEMLHANAVPFGDAGFASLAKLPKLKRLYADFLPNVSDTGMRALAKSPSLELATLGNSPLTDAGLAALSACQSLKSVRVGQTKVTAAGVAAFRKARPDVMLASDFDK